jgi:hypothetical protein
MTVSAVADSAVSTAPVIDPPGGATPGPVRCVSASTAGRSRRLAYAVSPHASESWNSWLDRAAADHGVPVGLFTLFLGVDIRAQPGDVRPLFAGLVLSPASRDAVIVATGLAPATVDGCSWRGTRARP